MPPSSLAISPSSVYEGVGLFGEEAIERVLRRADERGDRVVIALILGFDCKGQIDEPAGEPWRRFTPKLGGVILLYEEDDGEKTYGNSDEQWPAAGRWADEHCESWRVLATSLVALVWSVSMLGLSIQRNKISLRRSNLKRAPRYSQVSLYVLTCRAGHVSLRLFLTLSTKRGSRDENYWISRREVFGDIVSAVLDCRSSDGKRT